MCVEARRGSTRLDLQLEPWAWQSESYLQTLFRTSHERWWVEAPDAAP